MDTLEEVPQDDKAMIMLQDDEEIKVSIGHQPLPKKELLNEISPTLSPIISPIQAQTASMNIQENQHHQSQEPSPINQNDKVFELQIDDNIQDTSFDTINSEHLFVTSTEDQFPMSASKVQHSQVGSGNISNNVSNYLPGQQHQTKECIPALGDDSMIENELKQINQNLNTFTVEHFNNLRQQIQAVGFSKAANKAKRDFNLITSESTTTLNSVKDEYNEIGRQGTEEAKMHSKLNNMYSHNTTASKNLLNMPESKTKINKFDNENQEVAYVVSGLSPLIRKLTICEQVENQHLNQTQIAVVHSCSSSGFNSAPLLQYSDQESESKAYLDKSYSAQLIMNQLLSPQILESFIQTPITWITCGFENCVALTVYGILASWGYGASGCLGHNNYTSYTSPKLLVDGDLQGQFITYVESGGYHSAAISQDGQLFMWGRSDVGQVGLPKAEINEDEMGFVALAPKRISHFQKLNRKIKQVALGEAHTIVLDEQGHVYSFGWGELGQLGISNLSQNKDTQFNINKIKFFETFPCERISAGAVFSLALTKQKGRIYAWGSGQNGQLGLGSVKNCDFPVFVDFLQNDRIVDIQCGDSHALALSDKGVVYGWGQGISHSQSLIKSLRDSSIVSTNFQKCSSNTTNQQEQNQDSIQKVNQLEVICFFPRILSEVDIAHTFLIKKKRNMPQITSSQQLECQVLNKDQSTSEINSSQSSGQSRTFKRLYTNSGRNMPSNNTICEVSERDSEMDERSQILKRQELKSIILTSQGNSIKIGNNINSNNNKNYTNQISKSIKGKTKIEMIPRRSPSPKNESLLSQALGSASSAIAFGRKQSMQNTRLQLPSTSMQSQMKLDNPNRMQSKQSKVVMLMQDVPEKGEISSDINKSQGTKKGVGKEDIIKKLQEFTQGNIFNDVLSKTQKVQAENLNQSSLNSSSSVLIGISQAAQQKNMNSTTNITSNNTNLANSMLPPSCQKTHSKQQSRLQTYSNSIIESFSTKRFKMPTDMNSSSVLGYQSNNSSRISIRDTDHCNKTQRIRSPQPDTSVLSKFNSNKYSSPKLDTTQKNKTPLNNSSSNAAYTTIASTNAHANTTQSRPQGCQTVLGKDMLRDLPSTTRNKNFQIKFSSGNNSYKKTAAATGGIASSNTVYNMNDTSKFSTSSNKSNVSTLISPSRKFIHKKNQSLGQYTFNENTVQKPKGPKIGYGGSGQQHQAGVSTTSTRISPKSGRRPLKNL